MSDEPGVDDDIKSLISGYKRAAVAHDRALELGNEKIANVQHDRGMSAYRALRLKTPEGPASLLEMLDDPEPAVRSWAAVHSLEFAPGRAERVLEELALLGGVRALLAKLALKEWHEGKLRFG